METEDFISRVACVQPFALLKKNIRFVSRGASGCSQAIRKKEKVARKEITQLFAQTFFRGGTQRSGATKDRDQSCSFCYLAEPFFFFLQMRRSINFITSSNSALN